MKPRYVNSELNCSWKYICVLTSCIWLILWLIVHQTQLVTGIPNVTSTTDAEVGIKMLLDSFPCKSIIVTMGSQGSVFWDDDGKKVSVIGAEKVKAVDTTGAGDCFVGTLAFCLANQDSLESAIKQATANASDSVLRKGTQSSFPSKLLWSLQNYNIVIESLTLLFGNKLNTDDQALIINNGRNDIIM